MSVAPGRARLALWMLLAGHSISRAGNVVTAFAVPFAVLAAGGGATEVGLAAFAATAPVVIGGPLGGVVLDRIGYVRSSVIADVVSGVTVAAIPLLAATVGLPLPALLALVFVSGLLDAPGQTAREVLAPRLAEQARMPLERVVGFLDAATRLSTLLGAPLAGALVALLGPQNALVVTAAAFAVSALLTAAFVRGAAAPRASDEPGTPSRGYWHDLAEGARFIVRDPLLRLIVGLVVVTNFFDAARGGALLPLYAEQNLGGAAALGLIVGAFGGAAFAGSVLFGFIAHRMPRRVPFALCFMLTAGPSMLAPAFGATTPWLIAASLVSGFAAGAINPILGAAELERTPPAMRARVVGMLTAACWAGIPLGGLVAGVAADAVGVRTVFAVIGVCYLVVAALPLLGGRWRLMERGAITRDRPEPAEPS